MFLDGNIQSAPTDLMGLLYKTIFRRMSPKDESGSGTPVAQVIAAV